MREVSCTSHPSHVQQVSPGGTDDAGLADSAMEESKDKPTRESESEVKTKRVFDRRNALVKDGNYVCSVCRKPVRKGHISQQFDHSHKACYDIAMDLR